MLNIAHRGASAAKPENSLEAFSEALRLGADGVELDVRRCASGELVVIHDATLRRTVQGKGRVSQMTLAQLQALSLRGGGKIPTLAEVLTRLGPKRYCFIELKTPEAALDVAKLMTQFIEKKYDKQKLVLISFDHKALARVKKRFPDITIGASFKRLTQRSLGKALSLCAAYIIPGYHGIRAPLLQNIAQAGGIKTLVWTVNRPSTIKRMQKLGVDGIMTDHPELL